MIIGTGKVYLYIGWSRSLKEKRMVVKSIIDKVKNKFNVSIAEIGNQDSYKSAVIGIACISNNTSYSNKCIQSVINYIEENTDAIIEKIEIQML